MPDKINDDNIDRLLDNATIEYSEIQEKIDNLPKEKVLDPVPRIDGGKKYSSRVNMAAYESLKKLQEDVTQKLSQNASSLSENKSSEEIDIINSKVNEWKTKDPYKRYQDLLTRQKNPIILTEPTFIQLQKDQKEKANKPKSNSPFSMSAKWKQSLGYKDSEPKEKSIQSPDVELSSIQKAEQFSINRNSITDPKNSFSMSAKWEQTFEHTITKQSEKTIEPEKSIERSEIDLDKDDK
ncbi:MAG TPA: hypothetical protein PKU77_00815 [Ferruginibacter sp.]|nr:hypothetical protein [Ferruginibacter sp.]